MPCSTCQRRKRSCDEQRPRCLACKTSHLRCAYNTSLPETLTFKNESEATMVRHRVLNESPQSNAPDISSSINENSPETSRYQQLEVPLNADLVNFGPEDMFDNRFEGVFAPQFSSWADDFYQTFSFDGTANADIDFAEMMFSNDDTCVEQALPNLSVLDGKSAETPEPSTSIPKKRSHDDHTISKKPKFDSLPVHLLAQHYSRQLTGRYSFKSADWTFYTYFFHRFTTSHPWVLSSILAWTSAHLYYSGKVESLDASLSHYGDCISHMSNTYGRDLDDIDATWPSEYDETRDRALSDAASDDIDAIFVAHFFLALFDLIAAKPRQIRKVLRFISHILSIPNVRENMGGVRSRVATWFCILDGKASAFQYGDGAVLDAMGGQDGVVQALNTSYKTLQQVYSVTYPDEERKGDEIQLPLLERMLRLMVLLRDITKYRQSPNQMNLINNLRLVLDVHRKEMDGIAAGGNFQGRSRSTWLVLIALYNSVEISFSRAFSPSAPRHSADKFAVTIIQVAQKLNGLRKAPLTSPPPTKIWPLPLVMAAIEVRDPVYKEWVIDRLRAYEQGAGDHYIYSRRFVETMCEREESLGQRVDWDGVMTEVNDGLVI